MNNRLAVRPARGQFGVTILEFIAFIGLAALVIAGALMLYNSGSSGARAKEFFQGLNSLALGAKQMAAGGNAQNVPASAITPPASWQAANNGWTYDGATITYTDNNDGSFSLEVSGLRSPDVAKQLTGKQIFQVAGLANGDSGVSWNRIRFQ